MSHLITPAELRKWCSIPVDQLESHPDRRVPFRIVPDSATMGDLMATTIVAEVEACRQQQRPCRLIVPCGPKCWYAPFTKLVNQKRLSLAHVVVFHMDECLDWEGRLLPRNHPYNFRTFMEKHFYGPVDPKLAVPEAQRHWLTPSNIAEVKQALAATPIDLTMGGWGQDGHIAYNQARRHPFSQLTLEQLRAASVRVQDNNLDTILALAQRTLGGAYQFVPPMSVTLGVAECLSAKKVQLFSDTGSWKQTALRVALFSPPTVEYPITLLQEHPDAMIVATRETATHPISENPDWEL